MEGLPRYLRVYGWIVRFGGKLGFVPYRYDTKSFEMKFKQSRRYAVIYGVHLTFVSTYLVMSTISVLNRMWEKDLSSSKKFQFLRDAYMNTVLCVQYWVMARSWGVHDKMHKDWLDLLNILNQRPDQYRLKQGKWFLEALVAVSAFNAVVRALKNVRLPDDPTALTSFFENPAALGPGPKFVLAYFQFYLVGFHLYIFTFTLATIICYTMTTISLVEVLRIQQTRLNSGLHVRWRNLGPVTIQKLHIRLAVPNQTFNDLFSNMVLALEIAAIGGFVMSTFLAAILGLVIGVVRAVFAAVAVTLFFRYFAKLHDNSEAVILSWRKLRGVPKWFQKFQIAFESQPLKIRVSSFYFVDKSFVLTLLGIMATIAANLILTFRYE